MTEKVKFARGFSRKTKSQIIGAIGDENDPWLKPVDTVFRGIPDPMSENDWLVQYNENGQTFQDFLEECPWLDQEKILGYQSVFNEKGGTLKENYPDGKIYLAQIGNFSSPNYQELIHFAEIYYNLEVKDYGSFLVEEEAGKMYLEKTLEEEEEEETALKKKRRRSNRPKRFEIHFRHKNDKVQLNCTKLLSNLKRLIPQDGLCLIVLTMFDLYEAEPDLFVAGLASGNERVALFSFARYDPALEFSHEFWYESELRRKMPLEKRQNLILIRSCKLLVHELGHLLGFDHCIFLECCMNGSGHLEEDFRQPIFLCPICLNKLKHLTSIDISERYSKMNHFFANHSMTKELEWLDKRTNIFFQN